MDVESCRQDCEVTRSTSCHLVVAKTLCGVVLAASGFCASLGLIGLVFQHALCPHFGSSQGLLLW